MSVSVTARLAGALTLAGLGTVGAFAPVALAQEDNAEKVIFTWAATGEPSSLNPIAGYSATDYYFWTASYHLLVDFDQDLGVEPSGGPDAGLATDIQVSDDRMELTYTIRDDVVWSDGTPLTALDVAYTPGPVSRRERTIAPELPDADRRRRRGDRRPHGAVADDRANVVVLGRDPVPVRLHPA